MNKPSLMLEINIPAPGTRPGAGFLHAYVESLCREIEESSEELSEYDIRTLCIHGAGGPNDLDLRVLTRTLHQQLDLSHTEKVIEIAPERITTANLSTYQNFHADLYRMNLGSLNYVDFQKLGLPYEFHHYVWIRKLLSYSDMTNVCIGLYAGIPKQSAPSMKDSLNRVMEFNPDQVCILPYHAAGNPAGGSRADPTGSGLNSTTGSGAGAGKTGQGRHAAATSPSQDGGSRANLTTGSGAGGMNAAQERPAAGTLSSQDGGTGTDGLSAVSDEDRAAIYDEAQRYLTEKGYEKTSIYEYAMPGKSSVRTHLLNTDCDYWGMGCGAVSFLDGGILRSTSDPDVYIKAQGDPAGIIVKAVNLDAKSLARNYALRALNAAEGLEMVSFRERFGAAAPDIPAALNSLVQEGLAQETDSGRIVLTSLAAANMTRVGRVLSGVR